MVKRRRTLSKSFELVGGTCFWKVGRTSHSQRQKGILEICERLKNLDKEAGCEDLSHDWLSLKVK